MKQQKKFDSQQEQQHSTQHQSAQNTAQEFATVEDLLRADAAQTTVPSGLANRLQKSSADFPRPTSFQICRINR